MAVSGLTCGNFMRQLWRIYGSNDNSAFHLWGSSQGAQLEVYTLHSPLDAIQQR